MKKHKKNMKNTKIRVRTKRSGGGIDPIRGVTFLIHHWFHMWHSGPAASYATVPREVMFAHPFKLSPLPPFPYPFSSSPSCHGDHVPYFPLHVCLPSLLSRAFACSFSGFCLRLPCLLGLRGVPGSPIPSLPRFFIYLPSSPLPRM